MNSPIPMILHCPACGLQHVDTATPDWACPPHRSHLCHACGCIWRPADVETVGFATISTAGKSDTWVEPKHAMSDQASDLLNDVRLLRDELSKGAAVHGVLVFREGMFSRASRLLDWISQGVAKRV